MGLFDGMFGLFKPKDEARPAKLPGRNEPCWCGSGQKYKKCHEPADQREQASKACSLNCGPT